MRLYAWARTQPEMDTFVVDPRRFRTSELLKNKRGNRIFCCPVYFMDLVLLLGHYNVCLSVDGCSLIRFNPHRFENFLLVVKASFWL